MAAFGPVNGIVPPMGYCPLSDKQVPLCQRELRENEALAYTYCQLDTSAFKKFLLEQPAEVWEDDYHAETNVKLTRPAHDAWGVKKIMFTFCDDYLQKVLDLPYSQNEEWRRHIIPIYEACGISESRVVRALLASMPPGNQIPVHHDTGFWVKHTHRMHVAIVTDDQHVSFLVGHKDEEGASGVQKYLFNEGRIVELNNQAKHAVNNNWNQSRVHFIFDYVDEGYPLQRFICQPGELVHQTRRSIDLARHAGARPAPSFIIIGAQKCGTTSMYEYLCGHPLVSRGTRRETHYFDWRWDSSLAANDMAGHRKAYMAFFHPDLHKYPSILTGESTPSYLLHGNLVIPRLKCVCPHLRKFIVMLRDPVERAYSQYSMVVDQNGTPEQLELRGHSAYANKTFLQVIREEIAAIETAGITATSTWNDLCHSLLLQKLPMNHGGHSIVLRGMYALQLLPWLEEFGMDNLLILSLGDLKGTATVQRTMSRVFDFVGLPSHTLEDTSAKNQRAKAAPMENEARALLTAFYAPYNERLFDLLNRRIENW